MSHFFVCFLFHFMMKYLNVYWIWKNVLSCRISGLMDHVLDIYLTFGNCAKSFAGITTEFSNKNLRIN